jgi:hypothetical protein
MTGLYWFLAFEFALGAVTKYWLAGNHRRRRDHPDRELILAKTDYANQTEFIVPTGGV